ncbi:MAG: Rax2 family protein [Actinomycetota bacterium]|nr:Rax2 family protein [Actinomycetota bacterium]
MNKRRVMILTCCTGVVAAVGAIAGPSSSATTCGWVVVPSADAGPVSELTAVYSSSATGAWAAGTTSSGDEFARAQPLIEHYDGTSWSIVSSPTKGSRYLADISFGAPNDGWVVGERPASVGSNQPDRTLAEHYDGSTWKTVPTPNVGDHGSILTSVWVRASNDVWAVGSSYKSATVTKALILHFDGSTWQVVPSPHSKKFSRALTTVNARTTVQGPEAWAGGFERKRKDPTATDKPLALQWDGTAWHKVHISVPEPNARLSGIFQLADNDVVAVGNRVVGTGSQAFNVNYNHSAIWSAPEPVHLGVYDRFASVYYGMAAGSYSDTDGRLHPLIESQSPFAGWGSNHWVVNDISGAPFDSWLNDIYGLGSAAWAVGAQAVPDRTTFVPGRKTLTVHNDCNQQPSPTTSPSPSSSASPTSSPSATP